MADTDNTDDIKDIRAKLETANRSLAQLRSENARLKNGKALTDAGLKLSAVQENALYGSFGKDESPDHEALVKRAEELGFKSAPAPTVPPGVPNPNNGQVPTQVDPNQQFVPQSMQVVIDPNSGQMYQVPSNPGLPPQVQQFPGQPPQMVPQQVASPQIPGQSGQWQPPQGSQPVDYNDLARQMGMQGLTQAEMANVMANRPQATNAQAYDAAVRAAQSPEAVLTVVSNMGAMHGIVVDDGE